MPFGLRSILRAEGKKIRGNFVEISALQTRPYRVVLVPMVINMLIEIASGSHGNQAQVHAVNILTQIFKDRDLSVEVEEFTVKFFELVLQGFKSQR